MCVCVCVCARARVRVFVSVCVYVWVFLRTTRYAEFVQYGIVPSVLYQRPILEQVASYLVRSRRGPPQATSTPVVQAGITMDDVVKSVSSPRQVNETPSKG